MKRLTRTIYDRKLGGICGGLAKYYEKDANLIRVIFLILFGYLKIPMLIIYIIGLMIIPNEDNF